MADAVAHASPSQEIAAFNPWKIGLVGVAETAKMSLNVSGAKAMTTIRLVRRRHSWLVCWFEKAGRRRKRPQ